MSIHRRREATELKRAFDEARFGADRTLNLRTSLPSAIEARGRAESWLREKQVAGATEVLLITGRGNSSPGGVSPVREAVYRLLSQMRRAGVVHSVEEHTAGSFVVTLASLRAMLEAPKRRRGPKLPAQADPPALRVLEAETRALLRQLAERTLDMLGVTPQASLVESEMLNQFSRLVAGLPSENTENLLRGAIVRALDEFGE